MNNNTVEARIEELENSGMVIVNVVTFENSRINIEYWDGKGAIMYFECITVEQYEANGYEVDGLEVKCVEF